MVFRKERVFQSALKVKKLSLQKLIEIKNLKTGKSKVVNNTTKVSHGVVISPDNKYAFISVEGIGGEPGKLDVIDIRKAKLISSIAVGKQAGGIALWKTVE